MSDRSLARALERGELPQGFHHAQHLRVACAYLDELDSAEAAGARMAEVLRRFAASVGQPEKYHHTITIFWIRMLARACAGAGTTDFDAIALRYPALLDKDLVGRFYSKAALDSSDARTGWVDPDLQPLSLQCR
ncbi:MAG: hypothetical protein ACM3SQ_07675 [Betaproteobacteria bacterium]